MRNILLTQHSMLHDLFTTEIIGKPQGGLNNFEHNCSLLGCQLMCTWFNPLPYMSLSAWGRSSVVLRIASNSGPGFINRYNHIRQEFLPMPSASHLITVVPTCLLVSETRLCDGENYLIHAYISLKQSTCLRIDSP